MSARPEILVRPIEVTSKSQGLILENVEFGDVEYAALLVSISPDEEDLISGAQRIGLELRIGITPVDEHLGVVFLEDQRAGLSQMGFHVGLFQPQAYIQILVIPQDGGSRVVEAALSRNHVHKARRLFRHLPGGLIEPAVNHNGPRRPARDIVRNILRRTTVTPCAFPHPGLTAARSAGPARRTLRSAKSGNSGIQ